MTSIEEWDEAQAWEKEWWGACNNTLGEEEKQLVYASKMGLKTFHNGSSPYNFAASGKILDIGGGPISMLLKTPGAKGTVVDPCHFPTWVYKRYKEAGINYLQIRGEDVDYYKKFDECWIYNVLQHTVDPEKVLRNALRAGKILRLFEWLEVGVSAGHPHTLTKSQMDEWLGGYGKAEQVNQNGCVGLCYYGIFFGE
jgi:2-polyprenyl-3-methyl-5-hydroxy-6-metoxy-1,4-benzoquinol methylase